MAAVNLAECLVIKRENLFLLAPRDGRIAAGEEHPLGLWFRDCRFLSVHELLVDGAPLLVLRSSDAGGARSCSAASRGAATRRPSPTQSPAGRKPGPPGRSPTC
jgi:hypothetical protein